MSWDDDLDAAAAGLVESLGVEAIYSNATTDLSCSVLIRRDLQSRPEDLFSQVRARELRVDVLVAEIGGVDVIARGDSIRIGSARYLVDRVEADNGVIATVVVIEDET